MENKFTKGEWFVSNDNQIVSMPSQCKITNRVSGWNPEEAKANAKLIAAAPDLLAACICESILDKCERNKAIYELQQYGYKGLESPQHFVDSLRIQAIKKATE